MRRRVWHRTGLSPKGGRPAFRTYLPLFHTHPSALYRGRFQLRFPTDAAASQFQQQCHETGLTIDVTSVHDTSRSGAARPDELTTPQRDLLELALGSGYFAIPRQATLVELAEELGVSDQAASERLRRAQRKLATAYFKR